MEAAAKEVRHTRLRQVTTTSRDVVGSWMPPPSSSDSRDGDGNDSRSSAAAHHWLPGSATTAATPKKASLKRLVCRRPLENEVGSSSPGDGGPPWSTFVFGDH